MKILHTADLHIGKRLGAASRLLEQRDFVRELVKQAEEHDVDVVLIAGDVFDTSVPGSEAERLFFDGVRALSDSGRVVIALAGNHDDERRLCAAKPLADSYGIILAGEIDYSDLGDNALKESAPPASLLEVAAACDYLKRQRLQITGVYGGVKIRKVDGNDSVNIALVPYPSEGRLRRWAEQDYTRSYTERVKALLGSACDGVFGEGYNILATHLFLTQSKSDELLGGLEALPVSVLPESADYVALGHIHKYFKVCKSPLAVYCGSPIQYAYDESRDKVAIVIDTQKRTHTPIHIRSGKKLTEADADNFEECMQKLEMCKSDFVRIRYGGEPLGKAETSAIKAHPAYNDLVVAVRGNKSQDVVRRAHLSDGELFDEFYKMKTGAAPSAALKDAFLRIMEELTHEAD